MDEGIGEIIAALDRLDLRENTIVWFLSDYGAALPWGSNAPLRGAKGGDYEGGHWVPSIMSWPSRISEGAIGGPSWLTFLGHSKDSLWSVDLFRCESLILKTHWVMVIVDQCTRRIVGFAVCGGSPDGPTVCRMLRHIILGSAPPTHLGSDHDPLFEYQRWKANLRILGVKEVKTVPYVPL